MSIFRGTLTTHPTSSPKLSVFLALLFHLNATTYYSDNSPKFQLVLSNMKYLCLALLLMQNFWSFGQNLFKSTSGRIHFVSDAPLELIEAETESFRVLVDTAKMEFAITIPIRSFAGFNSPLQQQHFYENYLETDQYEFATYAGKILGDISFSPDTLQLTSKGKLNIHGVENLRIIPIKGIWKEYNTLHLISEFLIPLRDHDIDIPRVVNQKIAEQIRVDFECILKPE